MYSIDPVVATIIAAIAMGAMYAIGRAGGYTKGFDDGVRATLMKCLVEGYIDNPEDKLEVNHINSKRDDNRLENLEWVTRSENNQHAWTFGNKFFKLTKNHISKIRKKLTIDEESEMCEAYATGLFSQDELGKGFGISQSIVCRITQGVS